MADEHAALPVPPSIDRVPERSAAIDRTHFVIPECQTRVDIFPEYRDGKLHFFADVNIRQSPTIAAFLSILFTAVNDEPPATTLAIPPDFVRTMMENIGLGAREAGLSAMVARVKSYAANADRFAA